MNIDLKGKNILVTGASRGIGRGIAIALGNSGATVAVHYKQNKSAAETVAEESGNGSQVFRADLGSPARCEQLFRNVVQALGSIDVLINNAGIFLNSPMESSLWLDDWDKTLKVNLRAAAILSRSAILHFKNKGGGRIINIASRAAFRGDNPEHLAYAASKAGMVALTKSIARGYGRDGITTFLVAPGWVKTDMNKETVERYGEKAIIKDLALNKLTEPKDLAPMIVLLASGLADHATGTTIDINAGSYTH